MAEQNELARMSEQYAALTTEELEKIAVESSDLTDEARRALRSEVQKRGLDIAVHNADEGTHDELDFEQLTMLKRFRDLPAAMLAKGSLESAGIECFLADENIIRMDWFYSNLIGGIKLMVRPDDVTAANEILSQPIPEGIDYGGEENFEQPKCPRCGSLNITFQELNQPLSYGSAWAGVPLPIASPKWICEDCEAVWTDDDEPEPDAENKAEPHT